MEKKETELTQEQEQLIVQQYTKMYNEYKTRANRLAELEGDLHEHKIVLDTIKDLNKDRKCYRLAGGVLVERTIEEVVPAIEKNRDMIKEVIDSINKDLDKREKELIEFKSKYNIRIRGEPTPDKGEKKEEEKTGVLA